MLISLVPICLPRGDEDFTGRYATVTGWGRLKYGGGVPSVLQEVKVPIMENHVCQEMFRTAGHNKVILDSFLCAGYANGQKDSCEVCIFTSQFQTKITQLDNNTSISNINEPNRTINFCYDTRIQLNNFSYTANPG